jgi:hypothetical protein
MRSLLLCSLVSCVTTQMQLPPETTPSEVVEVDPDASVQEANPSETISSLEQVSLTDFQWSDEWALRPLEEELNGLALTRTERGEWILRSVEGSRRGPTTRGRGSPGLSSVDGGDMAIASYEDAPMVSGIGEALGGHHKRGSMSMPHPVPLPSSPNPLRAGTTDDNEDFDAYLSFLDGWTERPGVSGRYDAMEVSGRRAVIVRDATGAPLPGARVSVLDPATERVIWSGTTFGDGRMPFYPKLNPAGLPVVDGAVVPEGGWIVQASSNSQTISQRWTHEHSDLELQLDVEPVLGPVQLDVAFVIDTTGSMADEIARIKQTLLKLTERLGDEQEVELRYGAVLYRDLGDAYVTSRHPFTADLEAFDAALQDIQARGGGDMPESLNQGLAEAVGGLEWRDGVAKVAFVIADAPPHTDYQEDVSYSRSAASALHNGIRIHTVAASGLDDLGSLVFRQISQLTRGKFIFIEYGSVAASASDHGVVGSVSSNNLDDILYRQIRSEIQGWGREPLASVGSGR